MVTKLARADRGGVQVANPMVYIVRALDHYDELHTWVFADRARAEAKRDRWRKQNPTWKKVEVRERAVR
jgi:hypothetical protein